MPKIPYWFTQKFEGKLVQNQTYLLLLAFFSASLLMNYQHLIGNKNLFFCVAWFLGAVIFLNYKAWKAGILLLVLNFIVFAGSFPRTTNHSNLEFFITIILLSLFAIKAIRPKLQIPAVLMSYLFRVSLVTIYFYTGFHKLNTDFFDPSVSCVNYINDYNFGVLIGYGYKTPVHFSVLLQYATVFTEMILPFGLFWHKTRKYTAILLLCFHFYLSLNVFANFGSLAAFLILGAIADFSDVRLKKSTHKALRCYLGMVLLTVGLGPFLIISIKTETAKLIFGSLYNLGYLLFFIAYFKNRQTRISVFRSAYIFWPASCFILITAWSMKAYVGLGNSANLTMFSNILTEKSRSNHLLIDTKNTKIFDFEEDNVLVIKTHPNLKKYRIEGYKIPFTEFCYIIQNSVKRYPKDTLTCTIVYKGHTIVVEDLARSEFSKTKWWYKYLYFRPIQPEGPNCCMW